MDYLAQFLTVKNIIHYSLHFLFPGLVAFFIDKKTWKKTFLLFIATMLVDADHLFADPVFDPNRCSIGFHFLHSYFAIAAYSILIVVVKRKRVRYVFLGLLMHMATDYLDCLL